MQDTWSNTICPTFPSTLNLSPWWCHTCIWKPGSFWSAHEHLGIWKHAIENCAPFRLTTIMISLISLCYHTFFCLPHFAISITYILYITVLNSQQFVIFYMGRICNSPALLRNHNKNVLPLLLTVLTPLNGNISMSQHKSLT